MLKNVVYILEHIALYLTFLVAVTFFCYMKKYNIRNRIFMSKYEF